MGQQMQPHSPASSQLMTQASHTQLSQHTYSVEVASILQLNALQPAELCVSAAEKAVLQKRKHDDLQASPAIAFSLQCQW